MKMRVGKNPYVDLGCAMFFNILYLTGTINIETWMVGYTMIFALRIYNNWRKEHGRKE